MEFHNKKTLPVDHESKELEQEKIILSELNDYLSRKLEGMEK